MSQAGEQFWAQELGLLRVEVRPTPEGSIGSEGVALGALAVELAWIFTTARVELPHHSGAFLGAEGCWKRTRYGSSEHFRELGKKITKIGGPLDLKVLS